MEEILSCPKNENTLLLLNRLLRNDKGKEALKKKLFTLGEFLSQSVILSCLGQHFMDILLSDHGILVLEEKLMTAKEIWDLLVQYL